jgi:ABC-2 type transport system permease protein
VDAMKSVTFDANATSDVLRDVLVVAAFVVAALALGSGTLRRRTP